MPEFSNFNSWENNDQFPAYFHNHLTLREASIIHAPTMTITPSGVRQKQMTQENSNMNGDIAIMIRVKVGLTLY